MCNIVLVHPDPWRCAVVSATKLITHPLSPVTVVVRCLFCTSHGCMIRLKSGEFGANSTHCCAHQTIPEPFCFLAGNSILLRDHSHPGAPLPWKGEHGLHQCLAGCYCTVCAKATSTWMDGPKVSQQNTDQSLTVTLLACFPLIR